MGAGRSRRMNSSGGESFEGRESPGRDVGTMLSLLFRSGQVRVQADSSFHVDFSDFDDDDDDDYVYQNDVPKANQPEEVRTPDTSNIDDTALKQDLLYRNGRMKPISVPGMIFERAVGHKGSFGAADRSQIGSAFLPNAMRKIENFRSRVFCGTFSKEGNIFLSACQDAHIRIYNTENGKFKLEKKIRAKDVGWSVVDTAFSPDGNYLIYSSWSDCVHLCNIHGDHETHEALPMCPQGHYSFCMFSLMFSSDNREILGGANDGCIYVYDRERHERTLKIDSHEDDINAVAFADASSQILFSGGDDGLVKVWDRRTLDEANPQEVGTLAGHTDGITFIDPKGDGRYLISNCKDQSVKLWDVRKFSSARAMEATRQAVSKQSWDYRWEQAPRKSRRFTKKIDGDTSLMTYRGHSVLHTLIRCRFSPEFTTGQRFIYSGCATGAVVIYDILTGKVVDKLDGHGSCVRDASWHPYEHRLLSSSWDSTIGEWTYCPEEQDLSACCEGANIDRLRRFSQKARERKAVHKKTKRGRWM